LNKIYHKTQNDQSSIPSSITRAIYEPCFYIKEDIAVTISLKEAGEIMGIKILDHIIIGDGEYLSFVERGLL